MKTSRKPYDYIFVLLVGAPFLYAVNGAVIVTTIVEVTPLRLFLTGLFMLLGFMVVFYNKKTMIAAGIFLALAALYIWATWETRDEQREFLNELLLAARGMFLLEREHHRAAVMFICAGTSLFTALFLYVSFNFFLMAAVGGGVFAVSWIMQYRRDDSMFVIFMFCFFLMLVKFMNTKKNYGKAIRHPAADEDGGGLEARAAQPRTDFSSLSALLALPLCLAALFLAHIAPGQTDGSTDNPLRVLLNKPLSAVNEVFYLAFNPKFFTFQSTGFSNSPDRLGGSVTLNAREVMYVTAPGRVYLSGAVKNSYTGEAWEDTLGRELPTSVYNPGRYEFLETASALIRGATRYDASNYYFQFANDGFNFMLNSFPEEDRPYIESKSMPRIYTEDIISLVGYVQRGDSNLVGYLGSEHGVENAREKIGELKTEMEQAYGELNVQFDVIPYRENGYALSYLPREALTVSVITRTGSMFRPAKAWEPVIVPESVTSPTDFEPTPSGDWHAGDLLDEGAAYTFQYLAPNTNLTTVKDILKSAHRGFYSGNQADGNAVNLLFNRHINNRSMRNYSNKSVVDKGVILFNSLYQTYSYTENGAEQTSGDEMKFRGSVGDLSPLPEDAFNSSSEAMNESLAQYADAVYENFTALPESLPQRVYDLAEDLTQGLASDYEKVKAIEEYLLTFPYTLSPGDLPDGADFVDYFLFEGKEGYCTYYASAMAVLARCAGVPSRYVEGFLLPPSRNAHGVYVVTNEQAHTWAEVYLEGYGWLRLEPTAPYHSAVVSGSTSSVDSGLFSDDYMNDPGYQEHLRNMGFTDGAIEKTVPEAPPAAPELNEPLRFKFTFMTAVFIALGLLAVFAAILAFIGLQRLRERLRGRSLQKMPVNQQAQIYFKGLTRITSYYHYPVQRGETMQMYGERLRKRFAFKSDSIFLRDLIVIYYKACYGEKPISESELALLRGCYYDMVFFLRTVRKFPRYIFLRYVRRVTAL